MKTKQRMEIELYEKHTGRCPVREFIAELSPKDRVRATNAIKRLQEHGLALGRPHVGYLRDNIRELRIKTNHGNYRILFFIYYKHKAVLLYAISKKTQRVPAADIDKALEYSRDYRERHPGR